jgi:hypothetical protein
LGQHSESRRQSAVPFAGLDVGAARGTALGDGLPYLDRVIGVNLDQHACFVPLGFRGGLAIL